MDDEFYTVSSLAEKLHVSERHINKEHERGNIKATWVGKRKLFSKSEVSRYLKENTEK